MYQYLTTAELQRDAGFITEERVAKIFRSTTSNPSGSTFLSHSSTDIALLPGVIKILESHGANLYVDKRDASLPPVTNRKTAEALRDRIRQCSKLVVFATTKSKDSKWIPWELGLADSIKGISRVAILPGVDTATDTKWTEREYLGVYDRIVYGDLEGHRGKVWMVLDQEENSATELSYWLSR